MDYPLCNVSGIYVNEINESEPVPNGNYNLYTNRPKCLVCNICHRFKRLFSHCTNQYTSSAIETRNNISNKQTASIPFAEERKHKCAKGTQLTLFILFSYSLAELFFLPHFFCHLFISCKR